MGPGSNLFNVEISKFSKGDNLFGTQTESRAGFINKGSKANTLVLISDIVVLGYVVLDQSILNFNNHHAIFESDVQVNNNSQLILNNNSILSLGSGSNITVKTGSVLETIGSLGSEVTVTSVSGFYNFTISTGGIIRAEHTLFENMGYNGIYVNSGGTIDVASPFHNCTFQNGIGTGGSTLLKINNSQILTINEASFPVVGGTGACNISKANNNGEITFIDPSGSFCGCTYEDDPYDRIHWESSVGYNVALTAFLEGPFNGSGMNTDLLAENLIPLNQPYNSSPWNYDGTESVAAIPPNVVDWVLIELRDASDASLATGSRVFARKAAFILDNGYIVDLDGASSIFFNDIFSQQMYAVVFHYNHLGILSANALTLSGGKYSYDFSSNVSQVYGGTAGHKQLSTGYWGMFGGDGLPDQQINNADKLTSWSLHTGTAGYKRGDFNLDGQVNNNDKNDIWFENYGNTSQVPE
jgi:hypothetical protein